MYFDEVFDEIRKAGAAAGVPHTDRGRYFSHQVWKRLAAPYMYCHVSSYVLEWPSLTIQFIPGTATPCEDKFFYKQQVRDLLLLFLLSSYHLL